MTNNEAKYVLENVWNFATLTDDESGDILEKAIDIANIALETLEQIKNIIKEEYYQVTTDRPNKNDYNNVSADKFRRIWKVVSESETNMQAR